MRLSEAIESGKRFARSVDAETGDFVTADQFLADGISIDDYNATDYEVEPDVAGVLTAKILATAWDAAKGSSTSIAKSDKSDFFKRLVAHLQAAGVMN